MKIAVDARIISTSTGRYVERLLQHLQRIDHENDYIVLLLKKDFFIWQSANPRFTKKIADFPPYGIREQLNFMFLLYALRVNLVHFTMPQQPLLYFGRHITTIHDLTLLEIINKRKFNTFKSFYKNKLKPVVFRWAFKYFVKSSICIITPTTYVKNQLLKLGQITPSRVLVTNEAADDLTKLPQKPTWITEKDQFLLYVGNAYPYKNIWRLIEAFKKLQQPNLKLILIGKKDSFYENLEERTKKLGPNVFFAGFTPDNELTWLYQHASLYVFPSLSEGFGLPGLEAMSYGLPVLSSNATCLPEVYGDAAEYFDPLNVDEMAQKIDELIGDPQRREELKQKGLERVKQFSWDKMARETLEIYKKAPK